MELENDISGECFQSLGGDLIHSGHSDINFADLDCTGWSVEEKMAFLANPENRDLVRRNSKADLERRAYNLMLHIAFD